jgi:hypothetical protein
MGLTGLFQKKFAAPAAARQGQSRRDSSHTDNRAMPMFLEGKGAPKHVTYLTRLTASDNPTKSVESHVKKPVSGSRELELTY